jgi:uncharacterized protein DUF3592
VTLSRVISDQPSSASRGSVITTALVAAWPAALILGLIGLVNALRTWRQAAAASAWPIAPGVVVKSDVAKGKRGSSLGHGNTRWTVYHAELSYRYEVGGRQFEGHRAQFGARGTARVKAESQTAADAYSTGQAVQVHYDPKNPAESVLDAGLDSRWRRTVMLTAILLAVAVAGGITALLRR